MPRQPKLQILEGRRPLASDWQNPLRVRDVNDDDFVTPLDALIGINRLNVEGRTALPTRQVGSLEPYYDVNGDGFHSPIDVLIVINSLNGGLRLDVGLARDTGAGDGAGRDGLTNDPAMKGMVQGGANHLMVRLGQASQWRNATDQLHADGSFEISELELESLLGVPLADGEQELYFSAGASKQASELDDRTVVRFRLDQTRPTIRFLGEIAMDQADRLTIPISEPLSAVSLNRPQVKLFDVTWSEKTTFRDAGLAWTHERAELRPQSISVSSSGRELVIVPPPNTRSIKYLVDLNAAVEDRAGNMFDAQSSSIVRANYFSSFAPDLALGSTVRTLLEIQPRITEFEIRLDRDDLLIWAGDHSTSSIARYELHDSIGNMRVLLDAATTTGDVTASTKPLLIPLRQGTYRLRIVDHPLSLNLFRIYLASQLPEFQAERSSGNSDVWPLDVFRAHLNAGERWYFERVEATGKPIVREIFDPFGDLSLLNQTQNGDQWLDVATSGEYVVFVNRTGYRSHRTVPIVRHAEIGQMIAGTVASPGQKERVVFATTPGSIYVLNFDTIGSALSARYSLSNGFFRDFHTHLVPFVATEKAAFVELELTSADRANLGYRFSLQSLDGAPELKFDTVYAAPAAGQLLLLASPTVDPPSSITLAGKHRFSVFDVEREQLLDGYYNREARTFGGLGNRYVVFVTREAGETGNWTAHRPITYSRQIALGKEERVNISMRLEKYEFAFAAQDTDLYRLRYALPANPYALNLESHFSIEDAQGRKQTPIHIGLGQIAWRLEGAANYRLAVSGGLFIASGGSQEVTLTLDSAASFPRLGFLVENQLESKTPVAFQIPKGSNRLFLVTPDYPHDAIWTLYSERHGYSDVRFINTETRDERYHRLQMADLQLAADDSYRLLASRSSPSDVAVKFLSRIDAVLERIDVIPGERRLGRLLGAGDQARLAMRLERGQRFSIDELAYDDQSVAANCGTSDFGKHIELGKLLIAPDTGIYEIQLRNMKSAPAEFSFLITGPPIAPLGRGIAGFGVEYEGIVKPRAEETIKFRAEAGTIFQVDGLHRAGSVRYVITGPDDLPIDGSDFRRNLVVAKSAGDYTIHLSTYSSDPEPYRFMLRDASTAQLISLNTPISDDELKPMRSRLYRLELASPSAVDVLTRFSQRNALQVLISPESPCGLNGNLAGQGTCLVTVTSFSGAPQPVHLAVADIGNAEAIETGEVNRVPLGTFSKNYFRFSTANDDAWLHFNLLLVESGFSRNLFGYIFDRSMRPLAITSGEQPVFFPSAGEYYLLIQSPGESLSADIHVRVIQSTLGTYTLGSTLQSSIARKFDVQEFDVSLDASANLAWRVTGGQIELTMWELTNGQVASDQQPLHRSHVGYSHFPAGKYRIRIVAHQDDLKYELRVIDLATVPMIQLGRKIDTQSIISAWRVDPSLGKKVIVDALGQSHALVISFERETAISQFATSYLPVLVDNTRASYLISFQDTSTLDVELSLPNDRPVPIPLGRIFEQRVRSAALQEVLTFRLETRTEVLVEVIANQASVILLNSEGKSVSLNSRGTTNCGVLEPGEYRILLSVKSLFEQYRVRIAPHGVLPRIDVNERTIITAIDTFRLTIPSSGKYAIQFFDTDAYQPERLVILYDLAGRAYEGAERMELKAGEYFLSYSSPTSQPLSLSFSISEFHETLELGNLNETISVNLTAIGVEERIVQIPVRVGQLVALEMIHLDPQISVQVRFTKYSIAADRADAWNDLQDFQQVQRIQRPGLIELRFSGKGSSAVKLIDLATLPILAFDKHLATTLASSQRLMGWRVPNEINRSFFVELTKSVKPFRLFLIDERGVQFDIPASKNAIAIVNQQSLYLLAERLDAATTPIDVDFTLRTQA